MPIKLTANSFLNLVRNSGLVEIDRLNHLLNELKAAEIDLEDAREIAGAFVARQVLTRWQADKLLQGKRGFFLGKYRLKSLLGKGGMSSVYLAEHVLMRRPCAIKVLPAKRVGDSSYLARFHREAQAVAALDHPNIVRAYDVDHQKEKNADIHFLVMEYVKGYSLHELVAKQGPLDFFETADYIRQAAAGLDHAHQAGLVHRDVKPGNLLVDKTGTVKVLDLGLARFFNQGNETSLTLSNDERVLGTADYLAPEQALDSHGVDHRADLYSLGCTMYFLLTGHPPFTEGTLAQRLMCHQTRRPPSIFTDRPDAPPSLVVIAEKMMAKRADQRFQTAAEVRAALEDWLLTNADDDWIQRHPGATGSGSGVALERRSESSVIMSLDDTAAEVPLRATPSSSFPCIEDPDLAAFLSSLETPLPERPPQGTYVAAPVNESSTADSDRIPDRRQQATIAKDDPPPTDASPDPADVSDPWRSLFANPGSDEPASNRLPPDAPQDVARRLGTPTQELRIEDAATSIPVAKPVESQHTSIPTAQPVDTPAPATGQGANNSVRPDARTVASGGSAKAGNSSDHDAATFAADDGQSGPEGQIASRFQPEFLSLGPPEPPEPEACGVAPAESVRGEITFPDFSSTPPLEVASNHDGLDVPPPDFARPEATNDFPEFTETRPRNASGRRPSGLRCRLDWPAMGTDKRILTGTVILLMSLVAWGVSSWTTKDNPGRIASDAIAPETRQPDNQISPPENRSGPTGARRELRVGPDSEFKTIGAALAYVADHRADYQFRRRSARVLIHVAGGQTYAESLIVDNAEGNRYPTGLQIIAAGSGPAVLAPSQPGPVVQLTGLERFVLENFEIHADGRADAIDLAGTLVGSRLSRLKIAGFTAAGVRGSGITGLLQEEVILEDLEFHGDSVQAAGIQFTSGDNRATSRVKVERCRFLGPLTTGISVENDASFLEIRECLFAEGESGIYFAGSRPKLREILIGNNTFYKTGRGIVFASMPHESSRELAFLRNLFAGVEGPEALIESDYSDASFNSMLSTNGAAIENNWSDRPSPESPPAGERNLMLRPEQERVQQFSFVSTDPADPTFLAPAPKSPHAAIPGTRRGLKPFIGAIGP